MYQSIYRKYRPQTFNDLYGQDSISMTLTNAIIHNRVAHAYLFSGPRGTGKTSSAKLLAKALNCTNIVDGKICDECENCTLVRNNNHPDVVEIDAASNNGVDEVRDLIEKVKYAPIKGQKKVYIIDEVHMMTQGAFNALLKTLEEPPEHVVFILATTEQHKVLPTIKSRCQKFEFKKINETEIKSCLIDILTKEDCLFEESALDIIADLCDGGMRDALSLLEQVMIYSNNNVTLTAVNEALDLISLEKLDELYNLIIQRNLNESLAYVTKLSHSSIDYKQVINELIKKAMTNLLNNRVEKIDLDQTNFLLNMIEVFDESSEKLKFDNSKKLYLDLAIIKSINYQRVAANQPTQITKETAPIIVNKTVEQIKENPIIEPIKQPIVQEDSEQITKQNDSVDEVVPVVEEYKQPTSTSDKPNHRINYIDEVELMNVLVQASRDDLNFVKDKWTKLNDYLINVNTKKNAGLLIDSIPVAASQEAIIVVSQNESDITLINNEAYINSIASFIKELMSEQRYCFAINADDWKALKDSYMQLRQVGNLPVAKTTLENIVLSQNETKKEEAENDLLTFGKRLFKDKLVVKREDDTNGY